MLLTAADIENNIEQTISPGDIILTRDNCDDKIPKRCVVKRHEKEKIWLVEVIGPEGGYKPEKMMTEAVWWGKKDCEYFEKGFVRIYQEKVDRARIKFEGTFRNYDVLYHAKEKKKYLGLIEKSKSFNLVEIDEERYSEGSNRYDYFEKNDLRVGDKYLDDKHVERIVFQVKENGMCSVKDNKNQEEQELKIDFVKDKVYEYQCYTGAAKTIMQLSASQEEQDQQENQSQSQSKTQPEETNQNQSQLWTVTRKSKSEPIWTVTRKSKSEPVREPEPTR